MQRDINSSCIYCSIFQTGAGWDTEVKEIDPFTKNQELFIESSFVETSILWRWITYLVLFEQISERLSVD